MNEGDYVRIRWGNGLQTISKCKNIVDMGDTQYAKDDFYIHTDHSGEVIYKTMIVKSSPNIIDLIEAGDYVNGKKVIKIWEEPFGEFASQTFMILDGEETAPTIRDIKSVVTKEMYSSVEYRVESN